MENSAIGESKQGQDTLSTWTAIPSNSVMVSQARVWMATVHREFSVPSLALTGAGSADLTSLNVCYTSSKYGTHITRVWVFLPDFHQ